VPRKLQSWRGALLFDLGVLAVYGAARNGLLAVEGS
jgi:hypothetical protein